jgi:hypothetical protein
MAPHLYARVTHLPSIDHLTVAKVEVKVRIHFVGEPVGVVKPCRFSGERLLPAERINAVR